MFKKIPLYSVIIAVIIAISLTFQTTYTLTYKAARRELAKQAQSAENAENTANNKIAAKIAELDKAYRKNYYGTLNDDELINGAAWGYILAAGDAHGQYLDSDALDELYADSSGKGVGIGIMVQAEEDWGVRILEIIPDSPASKADLAVGDIIVAVEGDKISDIGYDEMLDRFLGEVGTKITFTVKRGDEEKTLSVMRAEHTRPSVVYKMYSDKKTGIIHINHFDELTYRQFTAAVKALTKSGAERFLFDLRDNPGGALESITSVLDYLLPEGPIVHIIDNNGDEVELFESDEDCVDAPMAVLVNGNTASAAELFTSALRDYEKATIYGENTYGKGSMQTLFDLSDDTAALITVDHYLPPFSEDYDGVGIAPDVVIPNEDGQYVLNYHIDTENDTVLKKAIEQFISDQNADNNA